MGPPEAAPIDPTIGATDGLLLLALAFTGGRLTLQDLIHTVDYLDRMVVTAEELDGGLNRLMAAGLVEHESGVFFLADEPAAEFAVFSRGLKRSRFEAAEQFLKSRGPLASVPRRVTVSSQEWRTALEEYRGRFQPSFQRATKPGR